MNASRIASAFSAPSVAGCRQSPCARHFYRRQVAIRSARLLAVANAAGDEFGIHSPRLLNGRHHLDFEKAIVEFGTEAVLRYRTVAEPRHDNELPESFLRSFVALRLHERFGYQVHVERLYTAMAIDLGMPVTADLVTVLGAFRADVALYQHGRPFAVIELKIFDAPSPLPSVGLELDRAEILARFAKLRIFVGVMICPIIVSLEARIERLHDAFGGNMYIGDRQPSRDRQWQWCFACASLGEREGVRSY